MFIVDSVKSRTRSFSYGSLSVIARNVMLHLFVDKRSLCEKKESDTTQVYLARFSRKLFQTVVRQRGLIEIAGGRKPRQDQQRGSDTTLKP